MQNKYRCYSWRCLPTQYPPPLTPGAQGGLSTPPLLPPAPRGGAELPTAVLEVPRVQPSSTGAAQKGQHHHAAGPTWGCQQQNFGSWPPVKLPLNSSPTERSTDPRITRRGDIPMAGNLGTAGVSVAVSDLPRAAHQLQVRVPWAGAVMQRVRLQHS